MFIILEKTVKKESKNYRELLSISKAIDAVSEEELIHKENELKEIIEEEKEIKKVDDKKEDKDTEDSDLEDDVEDSDDDTPVDLTYSFEQEQVFKELNYQGGPLDYIKLWYGDSKSSSSFEFEDDYWGLSGDVGEVDSDMLSTEEARQTFVDIQYATVLGNSQSISSMDKRKFDTWIKFNKHLFQMFESMYSVTSDVDYKPLV